MNIVLINFPGSWDESVNNLWFRIITLKCIKFYWKTQSVDSHSPKFIHKDMTVPIRRIAGFCLQKWLILNFILTYRQSTHSQVHLNEQIQGFAIDMHPLRRERGVHSEKGVLMQFCHCALWHLHRTGWCGLLLLCHQPGWQASVLRIVGNYNTTGCECICEYRKVTRNTL